MDLLTDPYIAELRAMREHVESTLALYSATPSPVTSDDHATPSLCGSGVAGDPSIECKV